MDINFKGIFISFIFFLPSLTSADTFQYGILPVVGIYQSSLDLDTEKLTDVNVLSGLMIINAGRSSRYWIQAQYHSLDFEGSQTQIGQQVSGFDVAAIYQSKFRLSRHFKPWLGMGLSVTALEFKDRFITDNQGFLVQRFDNTTETGLAVDFNFTVDTDWFDDYGTGFSLRASVPVNDVLGKIEAGFYITF